MGNHTKDKRMSKITIDENVSTPSFRVNKEEKLSFEDFLLYVGRSWTNFGRSLLFLNKSDVEQIKTIIDNAVARHTIGRRKTKDV